MKDYNNSNGYLTIPQAARWVEAMFIENGITPRNIYKKIHHAINQQKLEVKPLNKRMNQVSKDSLEVWSLKQIEQEQGTELFTTSIMPAKTTNMIREKDVSEEIEQLKEIAFLLSNLDLNHLKPDAAYQAIKVIKRIVHDN